MAARQRAISVVSLNVELIHAQRETKRLIKREEKDKEGKNHC